MNKSQTIERAELIAELNEFIETLGAAGAVRSVAMARKAINILEADALELIRLRDIARDAANAVTQLQKQVLVLKAQQLAVPTTSAAIKRFEPELYDEDRVRMELDLDGDWVKYSDFLAQQVVVPMTNDQIEAACRFIEPSLDGPIAYDLLIARAIEKHHGIGAKQ